MADRPELDVHVAPNVRVVRRILIPFEPNVVAQRVFIHRNVVAIEEDAFRGWASLREVVIAPDSRLERIAPSAFADTALETFSAPDSLREIGAQAFANCRSLRTATLNEGLERIGREAFRDSGLESVYLPSTLREVGAGCFAGCANPLNAQLGMRPEENPRRWERAEENPPPEQINFL